MLDTEIREAQLSDRFDLSCTPVLLNGTQAIVRLLLMQKARDALSGLNTAGYVSGYRGSPLGTVDLQMLRAKNHLDQSDVVFQPGLNEDLAATAIWGTQQAELRGEGKFDGVFALWYGKGPGVARSGDAIMHGNFAGSSKHGGVLMLMGDDHVGESSTTLHQSDLALIDAYLPILSPAGIQEVIDFGMLGYALSRYSGNWVGLKCLKETIESSAIVDGRIDRVKISLPEFDLPPGGLNIRLGDSPKEMEARVMNFRRDAAKAFCTANRMNRPEWGTPASKIGFVASGKSWLDLMHAMSLLDLDKAEAERLGISTYKVGMIWPLDTEPMLRWSSSLDMIVFVEEKRKLIEIQAKDALFDAGRRQRILGGRDLDGNELFPTRYALDPVMIAEKIGNIIVSSGRDTDRLKNALQKLKAMPTLGNSEDYAVRTPYFCSGCPHNTSTRIPEGARAYAGIGCHYLAQWMDRNTSGFTQMGGEGSNWIGEAPFSKREHIFQNLGDGTYNHSGVNSVRAAVAAGTNITFKILFNDAVAMTGGQAIEGELGAPRVAGELASFGIKNLAIVFDEKEDIDFKAFPPEAKFYPRSELDHVQRRFQELKGVSAIIYVQTCAAEKRRRRKHGRFPDTGRRVFINQDICEGCGDCGVQSNCVSIVPVETEFGRKRAIDQSSCNQDFSCLNGFCPSFITLRGADLKNSDGVQFEAPDLPDPDFPKIEGTYNIVVAGIGGTGVLTVDSILAMAAHLDKQGVGVIQMLGFAQKGGAVTSHCRIARSPEDINAIRVANAEANLVIGCDLVVAAGSEIRTLMSRGRTKAAINRHEAITGEFTRNRNFRIPGDEMKNQIEAKLGAENAFFLDSTRIAKSAFGDSIYSNMMLFGLAWQKGWVPVTKEAILRAIELNGVAIKRNTDAFTLGRWAALDLDTVCTAVKAGSTDSVAATADGLIEQRKSHLRRHSNEKAADRFMSFVTRFHDNEMKEAVAESYHKLLAVKDEYEVARLHLSSASKAKDEFKGNFKMTFHLSPPLLARTGKDGRQKKYEFGQWMIHAFRIIASMKWLRGTWLDPFGRGSERLLQKEFTRQFETDMEEVLASGDPGKREIALELAKLPTTVRGYGPVWEESYRVAMTRRDELLTQFRTDQSEGLKFAAE